MKGYKMQPLVFLFAAAVLFILALTKFVDSKDKSAYDKTQERLHDVRVDIGDLKNMGDLLSKKTEEISNIARTNDIRVTDLLKQVVETQAEVQALQDHFAKLRESHFDLNGRVSKKRPIVKLPTGPIQVEIYQRTAEPAKTVNDKKPLGRGVSAIISR